METLTSFIMSECLYQSSFLSSITKPLECHEGIEPKALVAGLGWSVFTATR